MSIQNFYKDQDIFITGGSGFIGKVLIEKILRSLPSVGNIYILLRSKNTTNVQQRLEDILSIPLFRRVRSERPESFKKLVAIAGDCQELGLGISPFDLDKIRNVSIIFHVAATVRFDEDFKTSLLLNTRGTREMVKLAETLPNLKMLMHVSTTYAHPDVDLLEEKMYPAYADWRTSIKMAETCDLETLNALFPKYAPKHPNSYTFTKSLAEHIIEESRHKIPVSIFRPSIVIGSYQEPFPGWIDNFNGPTALLVACGLGILRTKLANPDIIHDLIPVDMCAKALIVSTWNASTPFNNQCSEADIPILNCCNSSKYLSNGDIISLGKEVILENPIEKSLWLPEGTITRYALWHYIRFFLFQIIPAIFFDCLIRIAQKPPILLKLQRKIVANSMVTDVFLNRWWSFDNTKLRNLESLIDAKERSIFKYLDYCDCDHMIYYQNTLRGFKEFLLKESPEASKRTRIRLRIIKVIHYVFQFFATYFFIQYLFRALTSS
ncbi:fatty acyl-CoA reductase wat-like [Haematobia irritans]|uniref:fatty acyl-CoA reductase wat-like n=1 Tax=Haematobia irritans TaxID=7368 RepID=UPI003F5074E7